MIFSDLNLLIYIYINKNEKVDKKVKKSWKGYFEVGPEAVPDRVC